MGPASSSSVDGGIMGSPSAASVKGSSGDLGLGLGSGGAGVCVTVCVYV